VVALGPAVVVNVVIVVAGGGDGSLEELVVGLLQHRRRGHEAAAGMAVDAHSLKIDEPVARRKLLDRAFRIRQRVISQVGITKTAICPDFEACINQILAFGSRAREGTGHVLSKSWLRSRIREDSVGGASLRAE
jgi:hypothetical protein